jgi:hypothetical protein
MISPLFSFLFKLQAAKDRTALAQGKYAIEQMASLSQMLSGHEEQLRNTRTALRELKKTGRLELIG